MLKKLRWKFIAVIMAVATLLLTVIFVSLYYTTKINYQQRSMEQLRTAIKGTMPSNLPRPSPNGNPPPRREEETPLLVVDVKDDGSMEIIKNHIYTITETDVSNLIAIVVHRNESTGILKDYQLRYLSEKRGPGKGVRYVFTDIYAEQSSLYWQAIHSLIIGASALSIFFAVSLALSKWMVKPVAEAWEQQQRFVADASHELKTPLTVILSNASMLTQSPHISSADDRNRINLVQQETERMKQLVEYLLSLARSDTGQRSSIFSILDLSYIVNRSVVTFEPIAYDMGKTFESNIQPQIKVNGDEQKLHQLTDILLDNACKYSDEGSTMILSLEKSTFKEAVLTVISQGAPLTKEEMEQIFDRFYRANPSRSGIPGYGLGLAIAYSIVEEHNGKIEVHTDHIDRNIFSVRIPIEEE